jgi:hypothetical protein
MRWKRGWATAVVWQKQNSPAIETKNIIEYLND